MSVCFALGHTECCALCGGFSVLLCFFPFTQGHTQSSSSLRRGFTFINLPPISFSWDHSALPEVLPFFHFFFAPSCLLITLGDREAPCKVNFLRSFQSKGISQPRHHHPSAGTHTPPRSLSHSGLCPPPRPLHAQLCLRGTVNCSVY